MSIQDLLNAIQVGEDSDWEFKSAKGGLPKSLWASYVAMANTDGGDIVLGVEDNGFVSGLKNASKMQTDFWNTINSKGHVSVNLLNNQCVRVETIESKVVLVITVPRADRRQRPVFLSPNPLTGTYRRHFEGDYHCSEQEVRRMLADQSEAPADSQILKGFTFDDLDSDSMQQYRNRFSAARPQHPWLELSVQDLLTKLGGWRKDKESDEEGLTVAGLLMFGKDEAIRDPAAIPQYQLDYREILADDSDVRWTDRVTIDGTWVGNLYQFYHRAIQKLTADLKIPFKLEPNLFRKDDTIVHEAVREALVNALIHADFRGQGGIVIEKHVNEFTLSNPGTLLLSFDQLLKGGVSECRNKSLQKMFLMIGGGEQAGSGIDKIRKGWNSQHWRLPRIQERAKPDRVKLVLPMVSLLPEESVAKLKECFDAKFDNLNDLERMALITADVEGEVSNSRMREICSEHPSDITSMFKGLVGKKMLKQYGHKRGTSYKLDLPTDKTGGAVDGTKAGGSADSEQTPQDLSSTPSSLAPSSPDKSSNSPEEGSNSPHSASNSPHKDPNSTHLDSNSTDLDSNSPHKDTSSPHKDSSSPHKDSSSPHKDSSSPHKGAPDPILKDPDLIRIAQPSRKHERISRDETQQIILALCASRFLTHRQIAELLNRNHQSVKDRFISPLVKAGKLRPKYSDLTNPNQAYITVDGNDASRKLKIEN